LRGASVIASGKAPESRPMDKFWLEELRGGRR
jgi:hypothetical protein